MTKFAIIGGRDFDDFEYMKSILDPMKPTMIISGGATGADALAYEYARQRGITFVCHPPSEEDKKNLGYAAACKRRSLRIVESAEIIIAFPTHSSRGTWHAIGLAKKLKKLYAIFKKE